MAPIVSAVRRIIRTVRPLRPRHAGIPVDPFIDGAPWIPMYPPHPALRRPVTFTAPRPRPMPPRELVARLSRPEYPNYGR